MSTTTQIDPLKLALSETERALNIMGGSRAKEETVVEWFRTTHRTLQQQFVKIVVVPVLRYLAASYANGYTDLRNEASARLAHKMLAAVTEEDMYLPFH